jgi:hypothetical protein
MAQTKAIEEARMTQEKDLRKEEMKTGITKANITAGAGKGPNYSDLQNEKMAKSYMAKNPAATELEAMAAVKNMLSGRAERQNTAQEALLIKREALMANNPLYMQQYRIAMVETDPVKKKRAQDIVDEIEKRSGVNQPAASGKVTTPPPGFKLD